MKHGSNTDKNSRDEVGEPAGESHSWIQLSTEQSISRWQGCASSLIRVPSVFHQWLRNLPGSSMVLVFTFPVRRPLAFRSNCQLGPMIRRRNDDASVPGERQIGTRQPAGDEFPLNCERAMVRNRREKGKFLLARFKTEGQLRVGLPVTGGWSPEGYDRGRLGQRPGRSRWTGMR